MSLFHHQPGQTPIEDASGLKIKGITLKSELDVHEANNVLIANVKYLSGRLTRKLAPFDFAWALQLHGEMFGDVWEWAGRLRTHPLTLGIEPHLIETKLYDLMKRLPYWKDLDWVMQASMLHHEAVVIHPFNNGNGRWSRMLGNVWLRMNGRPYIRWPEGVSGEVSIIRMEYIETLKAADNGDYGPLVELSRRYLPDAG